VKKKQLEEVNLWDVVPVRNAEWETTPEGKVVVLVPKFRNAFLVKWVQPRLAKPHFRIKLDEVGSHIWKRCDGATKVSAIAESLTLTFGDSVQPVAERMTKYLNHLERGDLLLVHQQ
jgi:hypothetical protein